MISVIVWLEFLSISLYMIVKTIVKIILQLQLKKHLIKQVI